MFLDKNWRSRIPKIPLKGVKLQSHSDKTQFSNAKDALAAVFALDVLRYVFYRSCVCCLFFFWGGGGGVGLVPSKVKKKQNMFLLQVFGCLREVGGFMMFHSHPTLNT